MKKTHLLIGLGISISLLTACQSSNSGSSSATTEAETTTQTTVSPKPVTDYTLYNSVLRIIRKSLRMLLTVTDKKNQIPKILMLIQLLIL